MKQFISIRIKILEKRNFFFESDSNANFTMCSQILNANTKKILIRNESEIIIKISRRKRFEQISKVDCDNCFQMTEIDMTIKSSKQKNKVLSTVNIFSIISTDGLTSMKTKLLNDFMMYENTKARKVYTKFIDEFSSLWKNHDFIDVFKANWMKISLKDNWQFKVIEKFKIYSLNTKNKEILNKTFDDFHEKNRFKWTDKTTFFSYSVFIAWKTVNEIRKDKTVVDIKKLNDFIVSKAYSMFFQSEIINDLKDCTHIFVLDANFFFYQWRMHSNDTYKLTVVTHWKQEIFLISVMNCRNSVVYVQRQMNIFLRQFQAFVKIYIDDIVVKSKFLSEHLHHLHQLFNFFVKRNINLNLIKIFLNYFEVTLLKQRVNAFDLSIIENKFKALTSLIISKTFVKLKTYFELIDYIKHYIHFYVSISRSFQDFKTSLLKMKFRNDVKRKTYTSKTKLLLTSKKKKSFKALQKALSNVFILIHFNFKKVLWIDLNEFKEHEFEIMIFHFRNEIAQNKIFQRTQIEFIMFLSRLSTSAKMNYWSIELKMTILIWIVKKMRHLIKFSKFSIMIQIDHSVTVKICKQKLITTTNLFIRNNIRFVRVSQYLSQFSLDVKHKFEKNNIISDALFRLSNTDVVSFEKENYSEFDAFYVYNTTLIKINKNFNDRIVQNYINDFKWRKHVLLLNKNDRLKKNAAVMSFVKENDFIYYIDQLTNIRRLCISKNCVKKILNIAYDNEHANYARIHDIIIRFWYIHELIKILRKYIQHCSKCLTCQIKKHKSYESLQSIDFSSIFFHTIIMNFVLTLLHEEAYDVIISSNVMLTVTDKFFKKILLMTKKSTYIAKNWANVFIKYLNIADWDYSKMILSDRDRKFLFDLWKSIFRTLKINFLYFTVYHSQIDESSERINQTVEIVLRHYLLNMNNSTEWSDVLSRFQIVLNNSSSASTFKTINEILYEFKSNQSLDLVANISEIDISKAKIEAIDVIAWSKLNHKRNYDRKHAFLFLKEESWAYLRMHHEYFISLFKNMTVKWFQRRINSFKIIKKIDNLTYRFQLSAHWKIHFVVSVQQLESTSNEFDSYNRISYDNSFSIFVERDNENEKSYEIEKLINKRIIKKDREKFTQYFVRWKEYDLEDDTWYSTNALKNVVDFIVDYETTFNAFNH